MRIENNQYPMNDLEHHLWELVLIEQAAEAPDMSKIIKLMDRATAASNWAEKCRMARQSNTISLIYPSAA